MTLFKIDSIVPDHATIAIPTPSFTSGTTVHVAETAEKRTIEKYSIDDLLDSLDGILANIDTDAIENARLDYLSEKHK